MPSRFRQAREAAFVMCLLENQRLRVTPDNLLWIVQEFLRPYSWLHRRIKLLEVTAPTDGRWYVEEVWAAWNAERRTIRIVADLCNVMYDPTPDESGNVWSKSVTSRVTLVEIHVVPLTDDTLRIFSIAPVDRGQWRVVDANKRPLPRNELDLLHIPAFGQNLEQLIIGLTRHILVSVRGPGYLGLGEPQKPERGPTIKTQEVASLPVASEPKGEPTPKQPRRSRGPQGGTLLRVKKVATLISEGKTKTQACREVGMDVRTYNGYAWDLKLIEGDNA